ncbi:FtsJ-like methyltransferase-domain-containing protein [Pelagophyceae sp. CCMP2097]|nr:FtsJ-like methyltransferase-domain-containing protein [Pelagophyceae sp. CCMP2097]
MAAEAPLSASLAPVEWYDCSAATVLGGAAPSVEAALATEALLVSARAALGGIERGAYLRARSAVSDFEAVGKGAFVCRSALKLAELDAVAHLVPESEGTFRFVDVCAAPGGFCEYVLWRCASRQQRAVGWSMSLSGHNADGFGASMNRDLWKTSAVLADVDRSLGDVHAVDGDGSGDLYLRANTDALKEAVLRRAGKEAAPRPLLVVGDGGFDAARDVDDQDTALQRLALCETACAIELVALGGTFVLKVFLPLRAAGTLELISAVDSTFAKLALIKPVASRSASGEMYLVAKSFRANDEERAGAVEALRRGADELGRGAALQEPQLRPNLARFVDAQRAALVDTQLEACRAIARIATEPAARTACDLDSYAALWSIPRWHLEQPQRKRRRHR